MTEKERVLDYLINKYNEGERDISSLCNKDDKEWYMSELKKKGIDGEVKEYIIQDHSWTGKRWKEWGLILY